MFDYKSIVTDDTLLVDFMECITSEECDKAYSAFRKSDNVNVGCVYVTDATFRVGDADKGVDVFTQYKLWQTRPERKVGQPVSIEGKNMEQLMEEYEELLIGTYILNHPNEKVNAGSVGNGYVTMIDWLRTTDFYSAPASTKYHESNPGGLLVHTLKVYNSAIELSSLSMFEDIPVSSIAVAALAHDWCKIGYYDTYEKNVKDKATGQWHTEIAYTVNQKGIPLGHGATSMYIASRFFSLKPEEACAIRWHMSLWNLATIETSEYQKALELSPLVMLIQWADHSATMPWFK